MAEPLLPGPRPGRPPRPHSRARSVAQHDMRDVRARLRGTIYEHVEPDTRSLREQYSARQIVDFCLDLAEVMLASGADTRSVEIAVIAVATKWNLAPLDLDFSGSAVTIQYSPTDGPPLVKVRSTRSDGSDLARLAWANQIVDDVIHDDRDMTSAVNALVAVLRMPPRWPMWLADVGLSVLGTSIAMQAGGGWRAGLGAFVLMLGIIVSGRWLTGRGYPQFFVSGAQGAVASVIGTLAIGAGVLTPTGAATMVAALVVLLLPHVQLVTWAQDAISGFRAMAVARAFTIGMLIAAIVVGVPAGIALTHWLRLEVDPSGIVTQALPLWASLSLTVVSAGANCFVQQASARVIPVAVVLSVAAGAALWQLKAFGLPLLGATFVASVLLGVLSTYAAVRMRTAVAAIAVPAFCGALLPGVAVSNALLNVMSGSSSSVLDFGSAVTVALAIGAGLVLGGLFATPGARRALRRGRRVEVHSVHSDTTAMPVIRDSGYDPGNGSVPRW
ncbi:threonine/serine exporter ThrE family protein [Curtobacterium sp. MCBD17_021]|uniref:threonine/serine ThrE exporter family protein n=1 Tax=Curtobacterium sp. MCBD17_021 TaxID=2175665 RepID=UPI000DA9E805|nr:threonine/serine exporter family protein [Curtobacterium sp. MCBD17_021]PZE64324.1 threonine/serine exporter family protein [Curtobacterium sp. MCBD17_021]